MMKAILSLLATIAVGLALAVSARAQNSDDDPMKRALSYMQAGNDSKAIAELTEVIRLRPQSADAYLLRSNLRATAGDHAGALADMNKVVELKPDMGSAYYGRAL